MNRPLILIDPTGLQSATSSEPEEDKGPVIEINTTTCRGILSCIGAKIKEGIEGFGRLFIGNSGPNDTDEEAYRERKRGGVDKQMTAAANNYLDGVETVTDGAVAAGPTGALNLQKTVTNNQLGRASDEEVYNAMGSAALNTALTVAPGGSGKVTSWVTKKVFSGLDSALQKKVVSAMKNGIVGPKGKEGIVKLSESEAKKTGFTHKLKILGKGGDIRIYGKVDENGHIIFQKVGRH